ncbi:MAG TPA: hypothetical protein VHM19_12720 [Polyangiales bacterium]|jgi:hypothetical protein|nr:hypothetical protein [Polyangiales bacterium]
MNHFDNKRPCVLAALLVLGGCTAQVETGDSREVAVTSDAQGFLQWKASLPKHPVDGYYWVEGDIPVAEADLEEFYYTSHHEATALTVATDPTSGALRVWSPTQRVNLTYCVSNGWNAKGATAKATIVNNVASAAAEWEAIIPVDFKYVSSQDGNCNDTNNNVLFSVEVAPATATQNTGFFPGDPKNLRHLYFLPAYLTDSAVWQHGYALHELGHILGFRHEHVRAPNAPCSEAPDFNWAGLTRYDYDSIMHYAGTGCGTSGPNADQKISFYDKKGAICAYTGGCEWAYMGKARDIAIGPHAEVWAISNTAGTSSFGNGYRLEKWNHQTLQWDLQPATSGCGVRIAVDNTGMPWWVDNQNKVFRMINNAPVSVPGVATDIGAGADGSVWAIGATAYGNGYAVWRYNAFFNTWFQAGGAGGVRVAVDPSGNALIVDAAGYVSRWNGTAWSTLINGGMRDVGVGANGSIWFTGSDSGPGGGSIYEYLPNTPPLYKVEKVTGNATDIAVAQNGQPWVVNSVQNSFIDLWEPWP